MPHIMDTLYFDKLVNNATPMFPNVTTAPPNVTTAPANVTTAPANVTTAPPNVTTAPFSNTTDAMCIMDVRMSTLVLTFISCILSILGSILIIYTFMKMPSIRNVLRQLLLALTLSDLLTAIGNIVGTIRYLYLMDSGDGCKRLQESDHICVAQSFVTTFSSMTSFFWTTFIAFHIFFHVSQRTDVTRSVFVFLGYSVLSYCIPGVITVTAASFGVLGSDNAVGTGSWCWIKHELNNTTQIMWMLLTGKFWEILCYVLTATLYILSKLKLILQRRSLTRRHFTMADITSNELRVEDENFLYVPFVLYALRIWGTIRFFLAISYGHIDNVTLNTTQETLLSLQSIGDSGQAFWNSVVFCVCDKTVRQYLVQTCLNRCCRNQHDIEPNERTPINT